MHIQALSLGPGISLTLVRENGRWRFSSWGRCIRPIASPPARDRALNFSTVEDAAAHFRALCPRD